MVANSSFVAKKDNLFEKSFVMQDDSMRMSRPIEASCEGGGSENMLNNLNIENIEIRRDNNGYYHKNESGYLKNDSETSNKNL